MGGLNLGEEQPHSDTKVRFWKTVSCHRSYTMPRLSAATRRKAVTLHQQGLSQTSIKKLAMLRIADTVVGQGKLMQQVKNTSSLFPFEIGRCAAVSSAQKWQKPVGPRYTHLLSGDIFMEELQPKSQISDMETRPSDSTMHENIGTGVLKNGRRYSGVMS